MATKANNKFTKVKPIEKTKKNKFEEDYSNDKANSQSSGLWSYVTTAYYYFTGYKPPRKRRSKNEGLIETERLKHLDLTGYLYTDKKICKKKFKDTLNSIYENAKVEFYKQNRTKFVYHFKLYMHEWMHPHKPYYFAMLDEDEYKVRGDNYLDLLQMSFKLFEKYK